MRALILVFLLISTTAFSQSQKYGNVWQFGDKVGIDFNSCSPVVITNGKNSGFEGCASISDSTGQLLFYTNSDTVWNKQNMMMANGNLINSSGTLSQVLIIKKPLSDSLYYIITTKVQGQGNLTLQYHTVDMSLNNGNGAVISKNNILTPIVVTEQVAATLHSNGSSIWVTTHEYETNNFYSFLVTQAGFSPFPVISAAGPAQYNCNSNINARGEIKFSPDGSKLAWNGNGVGDNDSTNVVTLFDFDNSTGQVSNPVVLPFSRGDFGLSFSPDNSKLYGTTWKALNFFSTDYNFIYQFDLSSGNPATIINSKQIIDSVPIPTSYGDIKIGPDGKIYVAINNSHYIGVINNPDLPGASCNYVSNGLFLGQKICHFGLNNYIEYTTYCTLSGVETAEENYSEFSISPNPAIHNIQLSFNADIQNATIEIFNSFGQRVRILKNINGTKITINREELSAGVYMLRLLKDQKTINTSKIIFVD